MTNDQDDNVSVMKSNIEIPQETHAEYIRYHDQVDTGSLDADAVIGESELLFSNNAPLEDRKRILFSLAHVGTLEAINILQRYLEGPVQELVTWATLCFNECRMFVKADELDEDQVVIMSGAGGDGRRMRWYFVLSAKDNKPFADHEQKIISNKLNEISNLLDSKIENIEFQEYAVLVTAMVSFEVAVGKLIEDVIRACNKGKRFLRFHYFVVNTKKPSQEDIQEYLDELVK